MMDYNSYYPVHPVPGQPPPPTMINSQHDCTPMLGGGSQMMLSNGSSSMMNHPQHALSGSQGMRHTPSSHHQQQQQHHHQQQPQQHYHNQQQHHQQQHQQHMGHPMNHHQHHQQHHQQQQHQHNQQQQQQQQQPSPHHGYHQLPPHPPISHSASPHPPHTPHAQQQQQQQPPPRPSTGPSPLHHHSPIHMNGPSPKIQQHGMMIAQPQSMNHLQTSMSSGPVHVSISASSGTVHHSSSQSMQQQSQSHNNHYSNNLMVQHQNQQYGQQSVNHQHIPHPSPPMGGHARPRSGGSQAGQPSPSSYLSPQPIQNVSQERCSNYNQSIPQTELRIIELNRRLQSRPRNRGPASPLPLIGSSDETMWWEKFACDFFDDDSSLTLRIPGEDEPAEFRIGRTLIPRFFRSYFNGGVTDLSLKLNSNREITSSHGCITLDCNQADIMTKNIIKHHGSNAFTNVVVHTEGQLILEFINNCSNNLVIKSWKFNATQCHEYIDRSNISTIPSSSNLVEPVTRFGLTKSTFNYLKMCMIMEPMQDLMAHHRQTQMDPRLCLKQLLYDKYNVKNIDDNRSQPVKKRKRKAPATQAAGTTAAANKKTKATSILTNGVDNPVNMPGRTASQLPQCALVMAVVEPSILGADYGDENERRITQLENDQYDANLNTNNHETVDSGNQTSQEQVELRISPPSQVSSEVPQEHNIETHENHAQSTQSSPKIFTSEDSKEQMTINGDSKILDDPTKMPYSSSSQSNKTSLITIKDEPELNDLSQKANHSTSSETTIITKTDAEVGPDEDSSRPPSVNNKIVGQTNGSSNKQNRRRSSERKETLREGLMRTSDFVVAMKDLKSEHPPLWRITTGNNLLQQFEPKSQKGVVLYENTNQYAGWNSEIKRDYVGVDVRLTQHTRNQTMVERLLLNFQNLDDVEKFHDRHFLIYLQILISTALDPKFGESLEKEPQHHDYFLTSRKIVEDIIKRHKFKLSVKLKLGETVMKNFEKYPNLIIRPMEKEKVPQFCRACNTNPSTQIVTFGNRSYDLHSYKPVKVTSEPTKVDDKEQNNYLCDPCLNIVKLYSEVHHMGWKFFNIAKEKAEQHRAKGKTVKAIMDECLSDEEWINMNYSERDSLWARIDQVI